LFPDARCVGGPAHSAVLLVDDHSGLIGTPDFVVTLPGAEVEYAGWFLRGEVQIEGNQRASSLAAGGLMDLKEIAAATELLAPDRLPITSRVRLNKCVLKSSGQSTPLDFAFDVGGKKNYVYGKGQKPRYRSTKSRGLISLGEIKDSFKIVCPAADGSQQVITIAAAGKKGEKRKIVLSNLAAGAAQAAHHFDTYYELMRDPQRRPVPERKGFDVSSKVVITRDGPVITDWPDNPDECRFGFFEEAVIRPARARR
jgi:hypothetical protein